ncbi:hypothetical protein ACQKCU_14055 [Heyndrickxia sporothermodurans]
MKKKKHFIYLFSITFSMLMLAIFIGGCDNRKTNQKPMKKNEVHAEQLKKLKIDENQFDRVIGWLNNDTIIYIKKHDKEYQVFKFQLVSGENKLLFKNKNPIKNVVISPDHTKLLVQTALHTNLAKLFLLDSNGKILFTKEIKSFDLTYEWNDLNPQRLAISVFFEDWTFKVYTLNVNTFKFTKESFSDPFVKWFGKDIIIYQKMDNNDIQLNAPLHKVSINHPYQQNNLLDSIFHFDTFHQYLMAIKIPSENNNKAEYQFYDLSMNKKYSFQVPHLSQFNDWLIPNYDFLIKDPMFISFVPYNSEAIDEYEKDFKLISYNLKNKNKRTLFEHLNNEPISCRQNGDLCLYGFQFEKMIDMNQNKIMPIVEFNKEKTRKSS